MNPIRFGQRLWLNWVEPTALRSHLREDRRHIQDRDLRVLKDTVTVKLNLECAVVPEMIDIACALQPEQVCLVPERREEVTTEGGLKRR